jgi:hypothetical protein
MDSIMDLVYFCRNGENEELRYSIRSAVKNLTFDKLWVVGGKPDWYSGPYIEVPQKGRKYQNVQENAYAILNNSEISDPFILMNDDFYIIKTVDAVDNFNGGYLLDRAKLYDLLAPMSKYTEKLFETNDFLVKKGIANPLDFELHVPIVIHKTGFKKAFTSRYLWRSLYGNLQHVPSVGMEEDVKVYVDGPLVPKSYSIDNLKYPYLSSDDGSFELLHKLLLKDMFPTPSIYEKPESVPKNNFYRYKKPLPQEKNKPEQPKKVLDSTSARPKSSKRYKKPAAVTQPITAKKSTRVRKITPPSPEELQRSIKVLEEQVSEIKRSLDLIKKEISETKNSD